MRDKSRRVTRVVSVLATALVVATVGLVAAPPASAVASTITYTLTGSSATMTSPLGTDSTGPCVDDAATGSYAYDVVRIKPTATGSYTISEDAASADGRLGLYAGAFDSTSQLTNCLAFVDENSSSPFSVSLTAGTTYTLVRSAAVNAGTGSYEFDVDGPGTLTVLTSTTTTLTTSPNPSELSKATTLKAVVAGGAPTGTVQFKDGATVLGSAPVVGGTAQLSVKSLKVGDHTLSATYSGDAAHDVSTDTHVHKVKFGPKPKVKLSVSDKTVSVGRKVKLTWVTTGADTVKASGDWKGKKPKKGAVKVKIKSLGVHIYKLKVTNVNGVDKARVKVVGIRAPKDFTVSLPDDVLTAGTKVRVKAVKLDAKERFKVFLDDELLAKGFADKRGLASTLALIPKDTKEGEHIVSVMGSNDARVGESVVQVVAPTKELDVKVDKAVLQFGKTNVVSVTGLVAGEDVTVIYEGDVLVEGVADEDGKFEYTFPVGDEIGEKTVTVVGQVPGRTGEATFKVQPGAGPDV